MEPPSAVVTITTLVGQAFTISKQIYSTINHIIAAPKHIKVIANDLEDFYNILGTLKGYLEDEALSLGVLHPATSNSLESVLRNPMTVFTEINEVILL